MKSVIADYRFRVHGLRIECTNGLIVRLTDYPRDLNIGPEVYKSDNGYQFTGQQSGTGMSAGVVDLEGIATLTGISRDEIASGVFDSARLYLFATSYKAPVEDEEPMGAAILGRTTLEDNNYRIEMMALVDALSQSVGRVYAASCDKDFGGQTYAGCKVDLGPLTVTGTITHISSGTVFRDSARSEPEDWFGAGTIRFTSGNNVGLKPLEIKAYGSDGTVVAFEPAYYAIQIGDEYEMIPGCRKRRLPDCRDKYNNILNFGGFPAIPSTSMYQQVGAK